MWTNGLGTVTVDDDYVVQGINDDLFASDVDKMLQKQDMAHPQHILAELTTSSVCTFEHQSIAYTHIVEAARIFAMLVTMLFLCYWLLSMETVSEASEESAAPRGLWSKVCKLCRAFSCSCKRSDSPAMWFWWQDPYSTFPERRYLLLLLCCLVMLQNPLLVYAYFHPSLYGSAKFRFAADSLSGMSIHGILFLWLCLVHGLRYQ